MSSGTVITEYSRELVNMEASEDERNHVTISEEERNHVTKSEEERDHVTISEEERNHVTISEEERNHVTISEEERNHVTISEEERDHVTISEEERNHVSISEEERSHVTISEEERNHVTISEEERNHVTISKEERNHVTKSEEERNHVTISEEEKTHVTINEEESSHVIISEEERNNVTISEEERNHVIISEEERNNVTISEEERNHVTITEEERNHVAISEEERNHVTISEEERNHVTISEEERNNATISEEAKNEPREENHENGNIKLNTLADLITVCRDKGYQIYNDKSNIPESEKKRLDSLKKNEIQNGKKKKHCADDLRAAKKRKVKNNATGSVHLSTEDNIFPKLGDSLETQSRKTSARSSLIGRSLATSRLSNVTTSTERPVKSIDTDEWHQMRMRRKSRKRREMNRSLVDILKKKQEEAEIISIKTLNSTENGERIDTKQPEQQIEENAETKQVDHSYRRTNSKPSNSTGENADTIEAMQLNCSDGRIGDSTMLNESSDTVEDNKQNSEIEVTALNSEYQQTRKKHGIHADITQSSGDTEKVLEEMQIKDGKSTLVLYNVKEDGKSSSKIIKKNEDLTEDMENVPSSVNHKTVIFVMKSEDDNREQHIGGENNSTVTHGNNNNYSHKASDDLENLSHTNKELSSNKTEQSSADTETIRREVRIQDGSSTLILYKVTENAKLRKTQTEKNEGLTNDLKDCPTSVDPESTNREMDCDSKNRDNESYGNENRGNSICAVNKSTVTPVERVNNSELLSNKSRDLAYNHEKHSLDEAAHLNNGVLDNTKCDIPSEELGSIEPNYGENTSKLDDIESKHIPDWTVICSDDVQRSIANKNEYDTECIQANIDREKNTHLIPGNQSINLNTENFDENDSNGDSSGKETSTSRNTVVKDKNKTHSDNSKENTAENSDTSMKSVTRKTPKRSLGNGFLVSSDNEDDVHSSGMKKSNPKTSTEDTHNVDNSSLSESKKPRQQGSKGDTKTTPNEELKPVKTLRELDGRYTISTGTTSNASSKLSSLSSEARMILLLTKVQQTNKQYGDEHVKTIDLLKETRLGLRNDYKKFRDGNDIEDEKISEKEVEADEKSVDKEDAVLEKMHEIPKEEPNAEEEPDAGEEVNLENADQEYCSEEETDNHDDKTGGHELNVDVNGDIVRSIKRNATRKIDTRWNPDHPMFKKKVASRKDLETKHPMKTKRSKNGTFDATDLPNDNEYVREAKRIYPHGFGNHGDDKKHLEKKTTAQPGHSESISNKEIMSEDQNKHNSRTSKIISNGPKGKQDNDTPRSIHHDRGRIEQRKIKSLKTNANNKIDDTPKETGTPRSNVNTGGKISLIPIKKKSQTSSLEDDNRLEIDRAFAKEYEMYLNGKTTIPNTRNNFHVKKHKGGSSKRNNTENWQNIDSEIQRTDNVNTINANDRWADADENEDSEYDSLNGRQNNYEHVENRTGNDSDKTGEEGSMSGAVDIVKSRQKFYNEVNNESARNPLTRDSRVLKLFKEIQHIRRMTGSYSDRLPSNEDNYAFSDPETGFLLMNYSSTYGDQQLRGRTSDQALNRFMHEKTDYEVCCKVKNVNMSLRKRERAHAELKHKLFLRT